MVLNTFTIVRPVVPIEGVSICGLAGHCPFKYIGNSELGNWLSPLPIHCQGGEMANVGKLPKKESFEKWMGNVPRIILPFSEFQKTPGWSRKMQNSHAQILKSEKNRKNKKN